MSFIKWPLLGALWISLVPTIAQATGPQSEMSQESILLEDMVGSCEVSLDQTLLTTKALVDLGSLKKKLSRMARYIKEFEAFHKKRGTKGYGLATAKTVPMLEGKFGPMIGLTTFSRELTPSEKFSMSNQLMGFLSALPRGKAMIASGGTMGKMDDTSGTGGGVGIGQALAMQLGLKTVSLTAADATEYRPAPADYLMFSMGGFGSESRLLYELSKALLVVGGGGQAYNEAIEYLQYNREGFLIVIDDPNLKGSAERLIKDPRFLQLAKADPRIIIAKSGTEAGLAVVERLKLRPGITNTSAAMKPGFNELSADADYHMLFPGLPSTVIGFSGWSDMGRSGEDIVSQAEFISAKVSFALNHIHEAIVASQGNVIYATAGNDPKFNIGLPAFETLAHNLPPAENVKYVALTKAGVNVSDLNPVMSAISYVTPSTDWDDRTQQFVVHLDTFVTSGGNRAVMDQSLQAAAMKKRQLHILGANTLNDMRIEELKKLNPNLTVMTPEQILQMTDRAIVEMLGVKPQPKANP